MGAPQKNPLRVLTEQERKQLQEIRRATSERADMVRKATVLLAVAEGKSFTEAGRGAGLSREGVSQVVERFNHRGLASLLIAAGRGRKPRYDATARQHIIQELQRVPDREHDQTATWSLALLQQALRKTAFPTISRETIRQVLHESGYHFQQTRTWCPTGTALRVRKAGTLQVADPKMQEKKR